MKAEDAATESAAPSGRMRPEIRDRWAGALESGEYEQGKGQLRKGDARCCLGVLCDLAVAAGVIPESAVDDDGTHRYGGAVDFPPSEVLEWAGLTNKTPMWTPDSTMAGRAWPNSTTTTTTRSRRSRSSSGSSCSDLPVLR